MVEAGWVGYISEAVGVQWASGSAVRVRCVRCECGASASATAVPVQCAGPHGASACSRDGKTVPREVGARWGRKG